MNVALSHAYGAQAGKEKHEMNIQKLLVCSEMWRSSPFTKPPPSTFRRQTPSPHTTPTLTPSPCGIDFAIHSVEVFASKRDGRWLVEEGVSPPMSGFDKGVLLGVKDVADDGSKELYA